MKDSTNPAHMENDDTSIHTDLSDLDLSSGDSDGRL